MVLSNGMKLLYFCSRQPRSSADCSILRDERLEFGPPQTFDFDFLPCMIVPCAVVAAGSKLPQKRRASVMNRRQLFYGTITVVIILGLFYLQSSDDKPRPATPPTEYLDPLTPAEEERIEELEQEIEEWQKDHSSAERCDKITNFGILTVSLGPYYVFVYPFVHSVEQFLFANDPCVNVTVFLWTDHVKEVQWHKPTRNSRLNILMTPRAFAPFPDASMRRFHAYLEQEAAILRMDWVWHIDIDAEFIEPVGPELLVDGMFAVAHADNYYYDGSEVVGVHADGRLRTMAEAGVVRTGRPGRFFKQDVLFDHGRVEVGLPPYGGGAAEIPEHLKKYYFYGGVWGGRAADTVRTFKTLVQWIDSDLSRGYIPAVHDESYVNRYFAEHPPARIFTTAYMNPVLYWTHPWLFKNFDEHKNSVSLLDAHACGVRHDNEYPIVFPHGWEWRCWDATEADRLWKPLVWNLFKCSKRPCPRKPGREAAPVPSDCTFCNL